MPGVRLHPAVLRMVAPERFVVIVGERNLTDILNEIAETRDRLWRMESAMQDKCPWVLAEIERELVSWTES